jgi:hypothetical protein
MSFSNFEKMKTAKTGRMKKFGFTVIDDGKDAENLEPTHH